MIKVVDEHKLIRSFAKIRAEMNDHLDAINENTNEINAQGDYVLKLEKMILKLHERLDDMQSQLSALSGSTQKTKDFKDIALTTREKEIFLYLYARGGDLIDYKHIARSVGYTEEMVQRYVASMIKKGIPLLKKKIDEHVYLVLDMDFRNRQAKENILHLG